MNALVSLEVAGAFLLLLILALGAVAIRRRVLQRAGGAIDLSLQLRTPTQGRGWVLGVGRFDHDELQWFRVFSLAHRPRRVLLRNELTVTKRRSPDGAERRALLAGSEVMECQTTDGPVLLGLDPSAVTGFLAWLESAPPGAPGSSRRR